MTAPPKHARRALIVEDEAIIAMLVEDMLQDLGFEIAGTATRLDLAMKLAEERDFDIAILDVNISGSEIYPVVDVLRQSGIPFLFATGYGALGLRPDLRTVPILQKPFTIDQLAAAIAACCAGTSGPG